MEQENNSVSATVGQMTMSPAPHDYLKRIADVGLLDNHDARLTALLYVEKHNDMRGFFEHSRYRIEPFKEMSLDDLLNYIQFLNKNNLVIKGKHPILNQTKRARHPLSKTGNDPVAR